MGLSGLGSLFGSHTYNSHKDRGNTVGKESKHVKETHQMVVVAAGKIDPVGAMMLACLGIEGVHAGGTLHHRVQSRIRHPAVTQSQETGSEGWPSDSSSIATTEIRNGNNGYSLSTSDNHTLLTGKTDFAQQLCF